MSVPGGARLGAALIAAAAGLGGAAAAYAGALPGPVQNIAHHMFGAPSPHGADLHRPRPGPDRSEPSTRSAPRPAKTAKSHGSSHTGKAHAKAKGHSKAKPHKSPPGQAKPRKSPPAQAKPRKSPPGQAKHHAKSADAKH